MKINHLILIILLNSVINMGKVTKKILCENVKNVNEATDCFNTELDEEYETCCFFEFKNSNKYIRERYCMPLTLQEFLKIHDTIKNIEIHKIELSPSHPIYNKLPNNNIPFDTIIKSTNFCSSIPIYRRRIGF